MPTHEKHYKAADPSDLVTDAVKKGITGSGGGILVQAGGVAPDERFVGEYSGIAKAALPNATDAVAANTIDVVVAVPSGATKVDILVVNATTGKFVSRTEDPDGTVSINVGAVGSYTVYARGVDASGRVGPFSAGDPVTVS